MKIQRKRVIPLLSETEKNDMENVELDEGVNGVSSGNIFQGGDRRLVKIHEVENDVHSEREME